MSTPTTTNAEGVEVATANSAHIAGDSGNNALYGTGGNDVYYGGAGNDAFVISANSMAASSATSNGIAAQAVVYDFGGAGGWSATNNDFMAFTGFGVGSTLTLTKDVALSDGTLGLTYDIHSATTGQDYTIFIHSVDGKVLGAGDYNFYS